MKSSNPTLDESALLADLQEYTFGPSSGPACVGLEVEMLALRGIQAVPLADIIDALQLLVLLGELNEVSVAGGPPCYEYGLIRLTFEPGGQLELVSPPRGSAAEALEDVHKLEMLLDRVLLWHGIRRANHGMNPWQRAVDIPLQTPLPRYEAMQQYFSELGPDGVRMMRLTCALQINVDNGGPDEVGRRWRLANLMSPILIGMFANSPIAGGRLTGWKSERARVVRSMDPTRTGAHSGLDGARDYLQFALDARILLRRTEQGYVRGEGGRTFRQWLHEGDAWGLPTLDDWRYHLTTLFPQVRPRGFLELRSMDAPPLRWRAVPVAMATTLLCDSSCRDTAIEWLEPYALELDALTVRSAHDALADPLVASLAQRLSGLAIDGISRMPPGWVTPAIVSDVYAFCDRYTDRGRCPADDLLDLQASSTGSTELTRMLTVEILA